MRPVPQPHPLCPRDDTALHGHQLAEFRFLACPCCQGIWVSQTDLERLMLAKRRRPDDDVFPSDAPPARKVESLARCICAGRPLMHTWEQQAVKVDVCTACHGLWLDSGELRQLADGVSPFTIYRQVLADTAKSTRDGLEALAQLGEPILGLIELFS